MPGDSLYKTALLNTYTDEEPAERAQQAPDGHGRWSHTDMVLADIFDLLGAIGYARGLFERPPNPYRRPGILPRQRRRDPAITAEIRRIAQEHADLHGYTLDE